MKVKLYVLLFLSAICLNSCSDSSDVVLSQGTLASVTTVSAVVVDAVNVRVTANMTSTGGSRIHLRGIVVGASQNPDKQTGRVLYDQNQTLGEYSFLFENFLEPNKTYYARAFIENQIGIQYGNSVSFTTGSPLTTKNVTDITATTAKLQGAISQPSTQDAVVEFVYNTSPNPTVNNNLGAPYTLVTGSDNYTISVSNLTPNTVYYVRALMINQETNIHYYGEQKQFKTTGYSGTGGGVIVYDRGEVVDGWRYLEIHPTNILYNNSSWIEWGPSPFISGISTQLGTGLSNSEKIASQVTQANCAAKLCLNLVRGGKSDWFLGSTDEMLIALKSLKSVGNILDSGWTSSQISAMYATYVYYNSFNSVVTTSSDSKSYAIKVYPMRRY